VEFVLHVHQIPDFLADKRVIGMTNIMESCIDEPT